MGTRVILDELAKTEIPASIRNQILVQNYLVSFGLYPSSGMWKDHNVSETGSVSVLSWMGQGRPTQLGPSSD
jgi:hypothetical protein